MWMVIKFMHGAADLTLLPSAAISRDLQAAEVITANRIRLWNKGVDSESFHPRFCNCEMRMRLSNGEPEKPLIIHVGRLGVEKSLDFLKQGVTSAETLHTGIFNHVFVRQEFVLFVSCICLFHVSGSCDSIVRTCV
ncbi:sulfoquinovosyl transferase SQD2-like isoform X1 [Asparagus officinalis]|uniref:sulfoquinovosyl transferase SQD2-like isoform X1 n=1 Tax=Asparagus officinalis TaxID=4686 RepID=UPI00098E3101|nr:sulfoquinovosyl transferase SQD2-like isoform X1 [Asparagus officinalis]XP_020245503.1 sulfoquinovosyl transferase SQD2-like isoform X1 [Asparagus officinalis]